MALSKEKFYRTLAEDNDIVMLGDSNHFSHLVLEHTAEILPALHRSGVNTLFLELPREIEPEIDDFFLTGKMPPYFQEYLNDSKTRAIAVAYMGLLVQAQHEGMRVSCFDRQRDREFDTGSAYGDYRKRMDANGSMVNYIKESIESIEVRWRGPKLPRKKEKYAVLVGTLARELLNQLTHEIAIGEPLRPTSFDSSPYSAEAFLSQKLRWETIERLSLILPKGEGELLFIKTKRMLHRYYRGEDIGPLAEEVRAMANAGMKHCKTQSDAISNVYTDWSIPEEVAMRRGKEHTITEAYRLFEQIDLYTKWLAEYTKEHPQKPLPEAQAFPGYLPFGSPGTGYVIER